MSERISKALYELNRSGIDGIESSLRWANAEAILTRLVADETAELRARLTATEQERDEARETHDAVFAKWRAKCDDCTTLRQLLADVEADLAALCQQNERLREAAIHAKDWIERAAPKVQDKTHNLVANRNDQLETTSIIRVKDYQVVLTLLENAILDSVALKAALADSEVQR